MHYDLSHLTQEPSQAVLGPVQDDEALLLYALCRVVCARRVLEFGGLPGASARNFLAAVGPEGVVYTVERSPMEPLAANHRIIPRQAGDVWGQDFEGQPLDLVFFDCHDYAQQLLAFENLTVCGVITPDTTLALHDTGLHPRQVLPEARLVPGGWIHQEAERKLVRYLLELGYDCVTFSANKPLPPLEYRHGLTLCRLRERF
jgi:predicted O-methyltransferase YrrM